MKRLLLIVALIVVVAVPFALRPERVSVRQADDTVVIITPHNEAIRYEFNRGFAAWYQARTGRTVAIDWRVIGGTSEIARFLEGEYTTAFENHWTRQLNKPWSAEIQSGFQNGRLPENAPALVKEARGAFMASEVSSGIDLFFGGGTYDFERQALAGRLVVSGLIQAHPQWFTEASIPRSVGGEDYYHADGKWIGTVLSSYGIVFNRDSLKRLGIEREPHAWADMTDPRLMGEVALADPTKSGSVAKAFENMVQQQMQRRYNAAGAATPAREAQAVREGWIDGMKLIQLIGANSRYFTDSSQKPPIDVAAGNCAVGLCIDFYGRQQEEAVRRRAAEGITVGAGRDRVGYASPPGGSVASVDPVGLLRGAPNRAVAVAFIEYVMSMDGQKLWNFRVGTPGGPEHFALRRMPVRRDYYGQAEFEALRSDPGESPYDQRDPLIYRAAWTGDVFREMAFIIRVMCQDTHGELKAAWRAINAAPEPAKARALAALQDMSAIEIDRVRGDIKRALTSKDKVDEVRMAKSLAETFRANYARAEALARGGE